MSPGARGVLERAAEDAHRRLVHVPRRAREDRGGDRAGVAALDRDAPTADHALDRPGRPVRRSPRERGRSGRAFRPGQHGHSERHGAGHPAHRRRERDGPDRALGDEVPDCANCSDLGGRCQCALLAAPPRRRHAPPVSVRPCSSSRSTSRRSRVVHAFLLAVRLTGCRARAGRSWQRGPGNRLEFAEDRKRPPHGLRLRPPATTAPAAGRLRRRAAPAPNPWPSPADRLLLGRHRARGSVAARGEVTRWRA